MKEIRPITPKQIKYLTRLIKQSADRTNIDNLEESTLIKTTIENIGIENLTLEDAREYIGTFIKLDNLYQEQYENETRKIEDSVKIIDFSKYIKK
ncbi:MAG: hypothetical protein ACRC5M_07325 [Anaeroplasmataceae bacterium]